MNSIDIKNNLIEIIKKENNRPIPAGILLKKFMAEYNFNDKHVIYKMIDELVSEKTFKESQGGSLLLGYTNGEIFYNRELTGILVINSKGDGYIKELDPITNDVIKEWFVFSTNINGALDNDTVVFNPMDKYNFNGVQNCVIKNVIKRNKDKFVGLFNKKSDGTYFIKNDNLKNYLDIKLDNINNLVDGHKILIQIDSYKKEKAFGHVIAIIGHINDIDSDILSVVYENGIKPDFDNQIIKDAESIKISPENIKARRSITDRDFITIDPSSSKDLDDAIFLAKEGNKYLLSVSIADVSSYVQYKSNLDNIAIERSTSIYLVDRVIPMLPHIISNDLCSLNQNEEKFTLTADMVINEQGEFEKIEIFPSIIISKNRFSYDEVNHYFETKEMKSNVDKKIYDQIDLCYKLHTILRKKMKKNGYINFDIKEPIIIVDQNNKVTDIQIKKHGIAQMMIEDFMVCANQAVTIKSNELNIPFIYRTHENPSLHKLKKFAIEAKKINFKINESDFDNINPKTISTWLENNLDNPSQHLINKLLLRCMGKAKYSTHNIGHFGLALKNYTHFTSPIRRYPDLIVHRLYWMHIFTPKLFSDEQRKEFSNNLDALCKSCSDSEVVAVQTEREVNTIKFCEYMETKIGKEFNGIISTITSFGMFIELENTIEGLVRIQNIGGDFYKYIDTNNTIIGSRTNKIFTFGQEVKIRVVSIDKLSRQINFELIGYEKEIKKSSIFINHDKKIRAKNNNIKY